VRSNRKRVENDASAKPSNLSLASCDLDLWPLETKADHFTATWEVHEVTWKKCSQVWLQTNERTGPINIEHVLFKKRNLIEQERRFSGLDHTLMDHVVRSTINKQEQVRQQDPYSANAEGGSYNYVQHPRPFSRSVFPSFIACLYTVLDSRDREWCTCIRQSSKQQFGLLWPWSSTSWPPRSTVVEFYLYPTIGTVLIHSAKPELTE